MNYKENTIKIQEFSEKDNQDLWKFISNMTCFSALLGLIKTGVNELIPYQLSTNIGHLITLLAISYSMKQSKIIGIINFSIKNLLQSGDKNKYICYVFGLKIDPEYQVYEIQNLFMCRIKEILLEKQCKVSKFYCYIKDYDKTNLEGYINLAFQQERSFTYMVESFDDINRIKMKINDEFNFLSEKPEKEDFYPDKINDFLDEETFKKKEYLGYFICANPNRTQFLGMHLWIHSVETQAHLIRLILPIQWYFSKLTIPVFMIIVSFLFLVLFKKFKEEFSFVFILIIGVFLGILFAFLKIRGLIYAKRQPILYLFCPFYKGVDEEQLEQLFLSFLIKLKEIYQWKYFYYKLILNQNHPFEKFIHKFFTDNGIKYMISRCIYDREEASLYLKDKLPLQDCIDPLDII